MLKSILQCIILDFLKIFPQNLFLYSLAEYAWESQNNASWDTLTHALLSFESTYTLLAPAPAHDQLLLHTYPLVIQRDHMGMITWIMLLIEQIIVDTETAPCYRTICHKQYLWHKKDMYYCSDCIPEKNIILQYLGDYRRHNIP